MTQIKIKENFMDRLRGMTTISTVSLTLLIISGCGFETNGGNNNNDSNTTLVTTKTLKIYYRSPDAGVGKSFRFDAASVPNASMISTDPFSVQYDVNSVKQFLATSGQLSGGETTDTFIGEYSYTGDFAYCEIFYYPKTGNYEAMLICGGSGSIYITVNADEFDGTPAGASKIFSYQTSGSVNIMFKM